MATFVLVHGAWHGGWCWKKIIPLLRQAGHDVFTPTLTGLGERIHLLTPEINLTTHINDIVGVLEYEDLQQVILVGHSSGGMVISGVAEKAGERLRQLVYLDAFLPESGKALNDYLSSEVLDDQLVHLKDGYKLPTPLPLQKQLEAYGITQSLDIDWMAPRIVDTPYETFTQPVYFTENKLKLLERVFIQTTMAPLFVEAAERAKRWGFGYYNLVQAGHHAMVTQPNELVKILLELARPGKVLTAEQLDTKVNYEVVEP